MTSEVIETIIWLIVLIGMTVLVHLCFKSKGGPK